ncbi:MAG TPA: hypothetical protein VMU50_23175 [Polyangia bacterium]|nr:hypothetical protein [Polyangia bacterium]
MSVILKARFLWVLPLAVVGSWLAVRTLAASTMTRATQAPPALVVATDVALEGPVAGVQDAALSRYIATLAARARRP